MNDFYGVVAQVIPVLLLTSVVEFRMADTSPFRRDADRRRIAAAMLVVLAMIIISEALALWGVASGTVGWLQLPIVCSGIIGAAALTLVPVCLPWVDLLTGRD